MTDDPSWPRASGWLAAPPGDRPVDLAVLGVGAHLTSLSPTQAHTTPAAIRDALARFSTYADGIDLREAVVPADLGDREDADADEPGTTEVVARATRLAPLVLALGGDNSVTYAVGRGVYGEALPQAGLVTFDAHHDLRDGVSNGSPVRRLVEAGLDGHRIVQVGIADFANSQMYARRARDLGITVVTRTEMLQRRLHEVVSDALDVAGAGGGPVYVDLDVDVCDRAVAPACPASLPGGLAAWELRLAARMCGADPRVRGMDICEIDATRDAPDGRTVRLAALLLLEIARGIADREM